MIGLDIVSSSTRGEDPFVVCLCLVPLPDRVGLISMGPYGPALINPDSLVSAMHFTTDWDGVLWNYCHVHAPSCTVPTDGWPEAQVGRCRAAQSGAQGRHEKYTPVGFTQLAGLAGMGGVELRKLLRAFLLLLRTRPLHTCHLSSHT